MHICGFSFTRTSSASRVKKKEQYACCLQCKCKLDSNHPKTLNGQDSDIFLILNWFILADLKRFKIQMVGQLCVNDNIL